MHVLETYIDLLDGFAHVQAHLNTVFGMIWQGNREARHTVITVTKNFYPHTLVLLQGNTHKQILVIFKDNYYVQFRAQVSNLLNHQWCFCLGTKLTDNTIDF